MATHLYILYLAADESISGWEFFLLIPKSPQSFPFINMKIKRVEKAINIKSEKDIYIYIYIYMKVAGKNIIQIGEYIMM